MSKLNNMSGAVPSAYTGSRMGYFGGDNAMKEMSGLSQFYPGEDQLTPEEFAKAYNLNYEGGMLPFRFLRAMGGMPPGFNTAVDEATIAKHSDNFRKRYGGGDMTTEQGLNPWVMMNKKGK